MPTYTVNQEDDWGTIAKKLGVSQTDLISKNSAISTLYPGVVLDVPNAAVSLQEFPTGEGPSTGWEGKYWEEPEEEEPKTTPITPEGKKPGPPLPEPIVIPPKYQPEEGFTLTPPGGGTKGAEEVIPEPVIPTPVAPVVTAPKVIPALVSPVTGAPVSVIQPGEGQPFQGGPTTLAEAIGQPAQAATPATPVQTPGRPTLYPTIVQNMIQSLSETLKNAASNQGFTPFVGLGAFNALDDLVNRIFLRERGSLRGTNYVSRTNTPASDMAALRAGQTTPWEAAQLEPGALGGATTWNMATAGPPLQAYTPTPEATGPAFVTNVSPEVAARFPTLSQRVFDPNSPEYQMLASTYGYSSSIVDYLIDQMGIWPLWMNVADQQRLGLSEQTMIELGYEWDGWGWTKKYEPTAAPEEREGGEGGGEGKAAAGGGRAAATRKPATSGSAKGYHRLAREAANYQSYLPYAGGGANYLRSAGGAGAGRGTSATGRRLNPAGMGLVTWRI